MVIVQLEKSDRKPEIRLATGSLAVFKDAILLDGYAQQNMTESEAASHIHALSRHLHILAR